MEAFSVTNLLQVSIGRDLGALEGLTAHVSACYGAPLNRGILTAVSYYLAARISSGSYRIRDRRAGSFVDMVLLSKAAGPATRG